jgi:hypothetical protein
MFYFRSRNYPLQQKSMLSSPAEAVPAYSPQSPLHAAVHLSQ